MFASKYLVLKNQLSKLCLIVGVALLSFACAGHQPSELGFPNINDPLVKYKSFNHQVELNYPEDWYLNDGNLFINIVPNKEDLLWEQGGSIFPNIAVIILPTPVPKTATAVAKGQVSIARGNRELGETAIIQPVTTVRINGKDAAFFEVKAESLVKEALSHFRYSIVLKISPYKAVLISGSYQSGDRDKIYDLVNTIAYNIEVLDD